MASAPRKKLSCVLRMFSPLERKHKLGTVCCWSLFGGPLLLCLLTLTVSTAQHSGEEIEKYFLSKPSLVTEPNITDYIRSHFTFLEAPIKINLNDTTQPFSNCSDSPAQTFGRVLLIKNLLNTGTGTGTGEPVDPDSNSNSDSDEAKLDPVPDPEIDPETEPNTLQSNYTDPEDYPESLVALERTARETLGNRNTSHVLKQIVDFFSDVNICLEFDPDWTVESIAQLNKTLPGPNPFFSIQYIQALVFEAYDNAAYNFENILKYAQTHLAPAQMLSVLAGITSHIERTNDIGSADILIAARYYKERLSAVTDEQVKESCAVADAKIDSFVTNILTTWAGDILKGTSFHIIKFSQYRADGGVKQRSYEYFLPQLIRITYEKAKRERGEDGLERLLRYIKSHPQSAQCLLAYIEISRIMRHSPDLAEQAQLSFLAATVRSDKMDGSAAAVTLLAQFAAGLPQGIRRLAFDETYEDYVVLESVGNPGYTLYISSWCNIYLYPHNNYKRGQNQKWRVVPFDAGRYFSFVNLETSMAFYEDGGKRVEGAKLSRGDHAMQWQVLPVIGSNVNVHLRNRRSGNYLSGGYLESSWFTGSKTNKRSKPNTYSQNYGTNQEWEINY